jgi:exopolysaccharide production protein ExoQ
VSRSGVVGGEPEPAAATPRLGRALWPLYLDRAIAGLLVAWIFISNEALIPLLLKGTEEHMTPADEAILRYLLLPGVGLAFGLSALSPRRTVELLLRNPFVPLLTIWVWLSVFWSVDPALSARRALGFTTYTLLAVHLVMRFAPQRLIFWFCVVFMTQLLMSVAFAVAVPRLAWMAEAGQLRGIFVHKNSLGAYRLWSAATLAATWPDRVIPRSATVLGMLLVLSLVLPTQSATALGLIVVVAALLVLVGVIRLPAHLAAMLFFLGIAVATVIAAVVILYPQIVLQLLGRDATLTGHAQLWAFVDHLIAQRPVLGYGYKAMFAQPSVDRWVVDALGWDAPHAHNGYREIVLDLGFVGLFLVLPILLGTLIVAVRRLIARPDTPALFAFLIVTGYLLRHLSESGLLHHANLVWVMVVIASYRMLGLPRPEGARDAAARIGLGLARR